MVPKRNSFTFTRVIGLVCAVAVTSNAATYYVATNGNNANSGSQQSPWLTIGYAASKTTAGDVVRVQVGTYNERVGINRSGTSGAWINYVCDGNVVCRGFDLSGVHYVRLIGFEITHANTTYSHGVVFNNTCSQVELIDNYIHNVKGQAVRCDTSGNSHLTMRGNKVFYTDCIYGVYTNASAYGMTTDQQGGYFLLEYNTMQRCGDVFIGSYGTNCIVRNNYCWDYRDVYWNATSSLHSDTFQDGSDGGQMYSRHHVYERNMCGDQVEANSHFGIWQDTGFGDTDMLIRGNVAYNYGSGGGTFGVEHVCLYNNTFYQMVMTSSSGNVFVFWNGNSYNQPSTGGLLANNSLDTTATVSEDPFAITGSGSSATETRNLGYNCPNNSSFISRSDPFFVNPASGTRDFHLRAGSPMRGVGTNVIWITSATGSGTSFTVNDPQLLIDGWGMVDGDKITVGKGGTMTVVTNINWATSTFYVKDSVTWTNKMPVYWGTDTSLDIGALPYGSTELTAATISQAGSTYTVTPNGDIRGVWFYVDGIPTTWVATAPYTATFASGAVTAKAYALYAHANPVVTANIGGNTPPSISVQPTSQTNVVGQTVTFTVRASGIPAPSYTWQTNNGTGSFVDVASGGTSSSWTTPTLAIGMNGWNVRVALTNSQGYVFSDTVHIGVTNGVSPLLLSDVSYIGNTWTTFGLTNANDQVQFSFDAYVSHPDADLGIGFSPNVVGDWTDLGPIVLFDVTGVIYARNGGVYKADNTLTYAPNTWYHISGTANILTHTYSVAVNGAVLASNYAFRTEQAGATQLSNFGANEGYSSLAIVSNLVWTPYVAGGPRPPQPPTGLVVVGIGP